MRRFVCGSVLACVLALVVPSNATTTTYTNAAAWNAAAAPGADTFYLENFQSFAADTSFQTSPVACDFFTIVQQGPGSFRNIIDVPPFLYSDNGGTTLASTYTNYGVTTVKMSFNDPLFAWGGNFYGGLGNEMLDLDLVSSGGGVLTTLQVPAGSSFFGFVTSGSAEDIDAIVFHSRTDLANGGEGFGLDNVQGATAAVVIPQPPVVPVPGAILLSMIGAGVVGWLRGRKTL